MKTTITILAALLVLSCTSKRPNYKLRIEQGNGWDKFTNTIDCDSFNMISTKEVIVYKNGIRTRVISEEAIIPYNIYN